MRLFVRVRQSWRRTAATGQAYMQFETVVRRVRRPAVGKRFPDMVEADVDLPEKYLGDAALAARNDDGTYRAEVQVKVNRQSLAAFLASGDLEWDVSPSRMRSR